MERKNEGNESKEMKWNSMQRHSSEQMKWNETEQNEIKRSEIKQKVRNELSKGLNKENMIDEEDKILLYKLYLKIKKEFENLDKSKLWFYFIRFIN